MRVDAEKLLAYAQGGALCNDFNSATIAHGLATPEGLVGHTAEGEDILPAGTECRLTISRRPLLSLPTVTLSTASETFVW